MKIALGCDHGGIVLKDSIINTLQKLNIDYIDYGCYDSNSVDYPDYALKVAESIINGECDKGILMCGTGIGISIAANKVKGIRAANVSDEFCAKATAQHNNSNILCLGGRVVSPEKAGKLVEIWIGTLFEGNRHIQRIKKIEDIESKYFK